MLSNDVLAIASAIPSSVVAQANTNPAAFANSFETGTAGPAWITNIPTSVVNSLNLVLAAPINADIDIAAAPQISSVFANTAIPTSVQSAFTDDPIGFIADVLTADSVPTWAAKLPTILQSQVGSAINLGLHTIASDFESSYKPTPTAPSAGIARGTASHGVSAYTGTIKPTGSPIAFTGAAAPMRTAAVGVAAFAAGAGALLNL